MGRALLVLETADERQKAKLWIDKAPVGTRVEFKASKRTLPQNDLLWALLTEVSQQLEHGGRRYDPGQWKAIFLHAFGREVSFLPSLDLKTFLPIELSSSDLSKDEMTNFIEFILKEGADRGVVFREQQNPAAESPSPAGNDAGSAPASEDGGAASPPSSSITGEDLAWLETVARMLWAATNVKGNADDNLDLLNNQRKAVPEYTGTSQEARNKAGSIYKRCKAVVLHEEPPEDALPIIAAYAGCSVEDVRCAP